MVANSKSKTSCSEDSLRQDMINESQIDLLEEYESNNDWHSFFAQNLVLDKEIEAFMNERPMNRVPDSKSIF